MAWLLLPCALLAGCSQLAVGFRDLSRRVRSFRNEALAFNQLEPEASRSAELPPSSGVPGRDLVGSRILVSSAGAAIHHRLHSASDLSFDLKPSFLQDAVVEENSCKSDGGCRHFASGRTCQCDETCFEKATITCCKDYMHFCLSHVTEKGDQPSIADAPITRSETLAWLLFWGLAMFVLLLMTCVVMRCHLSIPLEEMTWAEVERSNYNENTGELTFALEDEWSRLKFKSDEVEVMWRNWRRFHDIEQGSWGLLAGAFAGALIHGLRAWSLRDVECVKEALSQLLWIKAGHFAVLGGLFAMAVWCLRRPVAAKYWLTVLLFYFYLPASVLEPFSLGCRSLQSCHKEGNSAVKQAYRIADCGLQGSTATQILMTWILFQPWILSRYDLTLRVGSHWLVVLCMWTALHQWIYKEYMCGFDEFLFWLSLLSVSLLISARNTYRIEKSQRTRFVEDALQREEGRRLYASLENMLPQHVIEPILKKPEANIADSVDCASVLFVVISDFHQASAQITPSQLINFLNDIFVDFDRICSDRLVTKIETVGEEYIAAVGCLPKEKREAERLGHGVLLERLIDAADTMLQNQTRSVKFRMGIHSGPVVAGVIGRKLPRYRLFGDTINTAARMMQRGIDGQLQFGKETWQYFPEAMKDKVRRRGEIEMKGKGMIEVFNYSPAFSPARFSAATAGTGLASSAESSSKSASIMRDLIAARKSSAAADDVLDDEVRRKSRLYSSACRRFDLLADNMQIDLSKRLSKRSSSLFSFFLSERQGFTAEMNEEWFKQFHMLQIVGKCQLRFGQTALLLMLLTVGELLFMQTAEIWIYPHALYNKRSRWGVFCFCRFGAVWLTMLGWYVAKRAMWIQTRASIVQAVLFTYTSVCLAMVYMSYDALSFSESHYYQLLLEFTNAQNDDRIFERPHDVNLVCNFLLFSFVFVRMHPLLFWTSSGFIIISLSLILCHRVYNLTGNTQWLAPVSHQAQVLLVAQTVINIAVAHGDEQFSLARFKARDTIRILRHRTQDILVTLVPPLVVEELTLLPDFRAFPGHQYRHATIAQSDLCGFTKLASTRKPKDIVGFMSELFGKFDELSDKYSVYKVETVGDAYIAGMAEKPLTKNYSPAKVVVFALEMVRAVDDWATALGEKVSCRVGIAYGECKGGIVGNSSVRYHLFGQLLSVLEILESTSIEGRVQVSKACKEEVERQLADEPLAVEEQLNFVGRSEWSLMTSKGEMHSFDEVGGVTFLTQSNVPLRHKQARSSVLDRGVKIEPKRACSQRCSSR